MTSKNNAQQQRHYTFVRFIGISTLQKLLFFFHTEKHLTKHQTLTIVHVTRKITFIIELTCFITTFIVLKISIPKYTQ